MRDLHMDRCLMK